MAGTLRLTKFRDVDLSDPLFDSLKAQYIEFPDWFAKKKDEDVYVIDGDAGELRGFIYLKHEDGPITDVSPPLPPAARLKVGTLKVIAKGTKLGERIVKKIFDRALADGVDEIYVTVFDTHAGLIDLFERYGFVQKGKKHTANGDELVLLRDLRSQTGDIIKDYPFIHTKGKRAFLLAIKPEFHTDLFSDSILKTEDPSIVKDTAHSNTIHKVYIGRNNLTRMKRGDIVVIYRTTDIPGRAKYRSVATSICVVEEVKGRREFANTTDFVNFARKHSVFSDAELTDQFNSGGRLYAVKMTYNVALTKRVIRDKLINLVHISEQPRWDLRDLTLAQLNEIAELGEVNEDLIVD